MELALAYGGSGGDKLTESWDICVIVCVCGGYALLLV